MAETLTPRAGIGMTSARTRGRMVERLREQGIKDEMVLSAMGSVPRHLFVDQALESRAYEDTALPIGFGQTISNPYIVARMAELARHGENGHGRALGRVLEIGLGCGYQAAVLAQAGARGGVDGAHRRAGRQDARAAARTQGQQRQAQARRRHARGEGFRAVRRHRDRGGVCRGAAGTAGSSWPTAGAW